VHHADKMLVAVFFPHRRGSCDDTRREAERDLFWTLLPSSLFLLPPLARRMVSPSSAGHIRKGHFGEVISPAFFFS